LVLLAAWTWLPVSVCAAAGENRLIFDENGYFRTYYQFGWDRVDSKMLKEQGEQILGSAGLRRLERQVKKLLADLEIDWQEEDWRDYAVTRYVTISHSMEESADRLRAARTPPPPESWFAPDFDDSAWPCFTKPFAVGPNASSYFAQWSMASPGLEAALLRFRFVVPDPAKAGRLTLEADYIGGIRVFVNGTEIARGHLPDGPIDSDTAATGCGEPAYRYLLSELPEKQRKEVLERDFRGKQAPEYWGFAGWRAPPGSRLYRARNRTLKPVEIPPQIVRKGVNVVAIELRAAALHPMVVYEHAWISGFGRSSAWLHAALSRLELRATGQDVPSGVTRPEGMQVWVEDMHRRVYNCEYRPPGEPPGRIRLVGARNGTYSAQVVVGTDDELSGVRVVPSDLRSGNGRVIPASAVRVFGMAGHPAAEIIELGGGRLPVAEGFYTGDRRCFPEFIAAERFMPTLADEQARQAAWQRVDYFDHITFQVPSDIPAGTCQPYWLSLCTAADTEPGRYTGTVSLSADGAQTTRIPVELDVVDWSLPDPRHLQTMAAIEQSPYGVAKQYEVPLWSDEHFRLIERSLEQLARVGNDWWFVPVILGTEFGNRDDSMIRWAREKDDRLTFDFDVLDRYLDLIVRRCGPPRVISFVVMHGAPATVEVDVLDKSSGEKERLSLGGKQFDPAVRETVWRLFGGALYDHMKTRGLEQAMHWGYAWDTEGDPLLKPLLRTCAPNVYWTYGSHSAHGGSGGRMYGSSLEYYKSVVEIYGLTPGLTSQQGWKQPSLRLLNPRVLSSCHSTEGHSPPFNYRLLIDRALVSGYNGIGRIGGDYWAGSYFDGCVASAYHLAGFSILKVLWPGPRGAEPSARLEAILEGMQETEARIFIEQAIDRKLLPEETGRRVRGVLDRHNLETLHIPVHVAANLVTEGAPGWRSRSRRLYQAAADVAQVVKLDTDTVQLGAAAPEDEQAAPFGQIVVPALGRRNLAFGIRNWTSQPREWEATASEPWIRLPKSRGTVAGREDLQVTLDGETLQAGRTAEGTITVTDVASGAVRTVGITTQVGKALEAVCQSTIYNVTAGSHETKSLTLYNHTHAARDFSFKSSKPWLKAEPASDRLLPGDTASIRLTASTPNSTPGFHKAELVMTAADGKISNTMPFQMFVIPRYQQPRGLPQGQRVPLEQAHSQLVVSHRSMNRFRHQVDHEAHFGQTWSFWHSDKPAQIGTKTFQTALWVLPYHETVYKLEGSGVKAFSAEVGVNAIVAKEAAGHREIRVCFETHVDGQIAAHSGLMKSTDGPRLLVVEQLEKARELKLVTRLHQMLYTDDSYRGEFAYSNWAEPTLYR
jgi:hypothetical protein